MIGTMLFFLSGITAPFWYSVVHFVTTKTKSLIFGKVCGYRWVILFFIPILLLEDQYRPSDCIAITALGIGVIFGGGVRTWLESESKKEFLIANAVMLFLLGLVYLTCA